MILIFLLYLLLASTFTLAKAVLCFVQPVLFVAIRMILAGLILLAYCCWYELSFAIQKKDRWMFILACVFHIFFAYVLEFWALQYISSSNTALMYSLSPFITSLLSYFFFNERMGSKKIIGLLIGSFGLVLWIVLHTDMTESIVYSSSISRAELVLLAAVVSGAYGWIIVNQLIRVRGYSPPVVNGWAMLGGGCGALLTSYFLNEWSHPFSLANCTVNAPGLKQFIALFGPSIAPIALLICYTFALILIANILFYNLYGFLLTRYSATFLSFSGFLCPLCTAFLGHVFLGETVTGVFMIAVLIIFFGLYLFYQEELVALKKHEATN